MNSKTKIVVLRRRELLIGMIAVIAAIVLLIVLIAAFLGKEENPAESTVSKSAKSVSANVTASYTPGVYTASVTLNGNPVDIQVTVDKNNINSIEIVNMSDSVATMYPMLETSFQELSAAVIQNGSTKNITYASENKYTATMLLNAIQAALDKCTIQ